MSHASVIIAWLVVIAGLFSTFIGEQETFQVVSFMVGPAAVGLMLLVRVVGVGNTGHQARE